MEKSHRRSHSAPKAFSLTACSNTTSTCSNPAPPHGRIDPITTFSKPAHQDKHERLSLVLCQLPEKDLVNCRRVSRDWKISSDHTLYETAWGREIKPLIYQGSLVTDCTAIQRLAPLIASNQKLQNQLLEVILNSRELKQVDFAASNAATLLNASTQVSLELQQGTGFTFSGKNLSNVKIPGAILENGLFCNTTFTGSDLRGVRFHNANLAHARFDNCNLLGMEIGIFGSKRVNEFVRPENKNNPIIASSSDGKIVIAESKWNLLLYLRIYDPVTGAYTTVYNIESDYKGRYAGYDLAMLSRMGSTLKDAIPAIKHVAVNKDASFIAISNEEKVIGISVDAKGQVSTQFLSLELSEASHAQEERQLESIFHVGFDSKSNLIVGLQIKKQRCLRSHEVHVFNYASGKFIHQYAFEARASQRSNFYDPILRVLLNREKDTITMIAENCFSGHSDLTYNFKTQKRISFNSESKLNPSSCINLDSVDNWKTVLDVSEKATQAVRERQKHLMHHSKVLHTAYLDKGVVASITSNGVLHFWDSEHEQFASAQMRIDCLAPFVRLLSSGHLLIHDTHAADEYDATCVMFDLYTAPCLLSSHSNRLRDYPNTTISNTGQWIASRDQDSIFLIDSKTGKQIHQFHCPSNALCFSSDDTLLATGNQSVRIFDLKTKECLWKRRGHTDLVTNIVFSPDNQCIATFSKDGSAKVWGSPTGNCISFLNKVGSDPIIRTYFSPNNNLLISVSATAQDKLTLRIWNLRTEKLIKTLYRENDTDHFIYATDRILTIAVTRKIDRRYSTLDITTETLNSGDTITAVLDEGTWRFGNKLDLPDYGSGHSILQLNDKKDLVAAGGEADTGFGSGFPRITIYALEKTDVPIEVASWE